MDITKFNEKFNKLDGNIYTVEEKVDLVNGVYDANLIHDNVDSSTVNVYTGSKLTGDKVNTFVLSTPSLTPWKSSIRIIANKTPLYITYETTGDQVEAEDINNLQDAVNATQSALNNEISRATLSENTLTTNLNTETARATAAENTLTSNLNGEISRAKAAENTLTNTINTNKPIWDDKYTKNEIDNKFSQYTTNMDWKESVANYAAIATTYLTPDDGWTVNVKDTDITYRYNGTSWIPISANSIPLATSSLDGKMSAADKSKLDGIAAAATKTAQSATNGNIKINDIETIVYTHPATHPPSIIVQDANNRFATDAEKAAWNNKLDSTANAVSASKWATARTFNLTGDVTGSASVDGSANVSISATVVDDSHNHTSATITDFLAAVRATVLTGLSTATNSVIAATDTVLAALGKLQAQISANLTTLTSHIGNTSNPHSTTAAQVGLGNVTNESKATMFTSPTFTGTPAAPTAAAGTNTTQLATTAFVATAISSGNAATANKLQTARTINGVAFDGGANITITADPNAHTHDDRYYTESESDAKYATKSEISAAGYGNMLKSTYDTDGDGVVDSAESAAKLTTARTINGVAFDGSTNITIMAAPTAHTHSSIIHNDTRSTNFVPTAYDGLSVHLKSNGVDGLTDGGTYHGVLHIQQWTDLSGGQAHQLAFTDNGGIYHRKSIDASNWGTWEKLLTNKQGLTWNNLAGV